MWMLTENCQLNEFYRKERREYSDFSSVLPSKLIKSVPFPGMCLTDAVIYSQRFKMSTFVSLLIKIVTICRAAFRN